MNMCEMFMEKLDMLNIGYGWEGNKLIVFIEEVNQVDMLDLLSHLEYKEMPYTLDDETLTVMPPVEDTTDWEAVGLEIELFARQYIPEREDAFGKFMYHAELIKNGHMEVSMKDRDQIVEPYRSILIKILEKGGI